MPTKKSSRGGIGMKIGAGMVAAAALAAAAGYAAWEGMDKKQKTKLKTWAQKARRDVAGELSRAKKMSEGDYKRIVDRVMGHYGALRGVNQTELAKTTRELKSEWSRIRARAQAIIKRHQGEKAAAKKGVRAARKMRGK